MNSKLANLALCAALGLAAAPAAEAHGRYRHHHPHGGFGFYIGGPLYYGPWSWRGYPPPYWSEPRTVIIEREAPVYVQRQPVPPQAQATTLWYYCPDPAGYYPHVPSCNVQWVPVDPATLPPSR
jgi:hypothetical protein